MAKTSSRIPRVYVMSGVDGAVKVGVSVDPYRRIKNVRGATNVSFFTEPMDRAYDVERIAHKLLAEYQYRGEWFSVTVNDAIAAVSRAIRIVGGHEADVTENIQFSVGAIGNLNRRSKRVRKPNSIDYSIYISKDEMEILRKAERMSVWGVDNIIVRGAILYARKLINQAENDPDFVYT